ncbi:hypothetical protein Mesil_3611 (plasmid) [Allomeiothermus silvanus DSM 9946]|uniref:Holliday junction resolvase RuvC n=1 Tax=Allomeiothermus silvanus (strain ATCC 700542 / DSM 9946 / NBRC 106475 / NCIMB 13440 / VI-R2) TaxID=526227 RepID=D7BJP5_ALLS1|nr:hypothetical protein [Allomeiothermus silvanus]ADH65401.1 hypothetical protein Mesil_3611 [Allomeiothermus silvanus DSM 9946]
MVCIGIDPNQHGGYGVAVYRGRVFPFQITERPRRAGDYRLEEVAATLFSRATLLALEAIPQILPCSWQGERDRELLARTQRVIARITREAQRQGVKVCAYPGRWPHRVTQEDLAAGRGAWMQILLGRPWVSKEDLRGYLEGRYSPTAPMSEHHWDALGLVDLAQQRHR